jgi:hypothetical protein
MAGPDARIEVQGRCDPCRGNIRFTAASLARRRTLVVRDANGDVIAGANVSTHPSTVSFPVRFHRRASFFLSTRPGPESIAAATGVGDPRVVSIQVSLPATFVQTRT